jgi:hypothetical protein
MPKPRKRKTPAERRVITRAAKEVQLRLAGERAVREKAHRSGQHLPGPGIDGGQPPGYRVRRDLPGTEAGYMEETLSEVREAPRPYCG